MATEEGLEKTDAYWRARLELDVKKTETYLERIRESAIETCEMDEDENVAKSNKTEMRK